MSSITREQLKQATDNGSATLVDARTPEQFAQGHLPGAVSIPAEEVANLAPELLSDKAGKIITYCGGGACPKSQQAADALRALGYNDVSEYAGGTQDWEAAGLPFEEGAGEASNDARKPDNLWTAA